jgi:hypothetical protein
MNSDDVKFFAVLLLGASILASAIAWPLVWYNASTTSKAMEQGYSQKYYGANWVWEKNAERSEK